VIEAIMFSALGFLAASLIALVLLSAVWHRAVRLTTRRIEGAIPVSMAEIQADKDQLRAEFAMSTRRLETSVEQLKLKTTEQLADIGRKSESVRLLKNEVDEKTAAITALEAQEQSLRARLRSTEEELSLKAKALQEAESELATRASELSRLERNFNEKTSESDSQKVQMVALETQCESLKSKISDLEREVSVTEQKLAEERDKAEQTSRLLAVERDKVQNLTVQLINTEGRLASSKSEVESFTQTVAALEAEARRQAEIAAERDRTLAATRAEADRTRAEVMAAHREIENAARGYAAAIENLKAEKSMLEGALAQVRDDRERLQHEVASLKQDAESAWSSERVENALLRERINDVAAEVARLAANIEGSNSPIEQILSSTPAPQRQNGVHGHANTNGEDGGERPQSLAERIRALQMSSGRRA
jgi:chromosome segregation ATPase